MGNAQTRVGFEKKKGKMCLKGRGLPAFFSIFWKRPCLHGTGPGKKEQRAKERPGPIGGVVCGQVLWIKSKEKKGHKGNKHANKKATNGMRAGLGRGGGGQE